MFVRTRPPIDPVDLVLRICHDIQKTGTKRSRYAQRLTPVTMTSTANMEGLLRVADSVLKPVFHLNSSQPAYKVLDF